MPKSGGYDALRHTGEYQMRKSLENYRKCRITLPALFAAFPGDRIDLGSDPLGLGGQGLVIASRCCCSGAGGFTELELRI